MLYIDQKWELQNIFISNKCCSCELSIHQWILKKNTVYTKY